MTNLVWLVPLALGMGLVGLLAFLWSMRAGQLEDLDGAAQRVLLTVIADRPLPGKGSVTRRQRRADNGREAVSDQFDVIEKGSGS